MYCQSLELCTNPQNMKIWLLHHKYLPKLIQISFMAKPNPEHKREANSRKIDFQIVKVKQYKATIIP